MFVSNKTSLCLAKPLNQCTSLYIYLLPLGVRLGLFTPDLAFDVVARKRIERMKAPSMLLVDLCVTEMMKIVVSVVPKVHDAYYLHLL